MEMHGAPKDLLKIKDTNGGPIEGRVGGNFSLMIHFRSMPRDGVSKDDLSLPTIVLWLAHLDFHPVITFTMLPPCIQIQRLTCFCLECLTGSEHL